MENATLIVLQFYHDWFSHIFRLDDVSIFLAPLEIVMKPLIHHGRLCSALGSLKKKIFSYTNEDILSFCRMSGTYEEVSQKGFCVGTGLYRRDFAMAEYDAAAIVVSKEPISGNKIELQFKKVYSITASASG